MSAIFDAICDWDNLWLAYRRAARGKRGKASAAAFEYQLADRLVELQAELRDHTYQPGAYRHFFVHEPKRRKISAAPFRDRVVHHALCNVIEPLFERRVVAHSYANRKGKGTHRALNQLQHWARQYRYALRCDIVQHFASLDHALLRVKIARFVVDADVMWLVDTILDSGAGVLASEYAQVYFEGDDLFSACRPRGLPIGNLTSQFWSNVYLNDFDWFVTRELGCGEYVRYVDDFIMFSDSKRTLGQWRAAIVARLARERLTLHAAQAQWMPVSEGIPWLGFVVYPSHRLLKRRNAVNFARNFKRNLDDYGMGLASFEKLNACVKGWVNHVRYADTWGLRTHIFASKAIPGRRPRAMTMDQ
jgi:RNA-directed DNA polymerase